MKHCYCVKLMSDCKAITNDEYLDSGEQRAVASSKAQEKLRIARLKTSSCRMLTDCMCSVYDDL